MTQGLKRDPTSPDTAPADTAPSSGPFTAHRLRRAPERRPFEPHAAPGREGAAPADLDGTLKRLESSLAEFESGHAEADAGDPGDGADAAASPPDFELEVDLATLDLTTERLLAWVEEDRARRDGASAAGELSGVLREIVGRLERVEAACGLAPGAGDEEARLAGRLKAIARRPDTWPRAERARMPPALDLPAIHDPEHSGADAQGAGPEQGEPRSGLLSGRRRPDD